jgi:multiple sugar transport system substrate-binding protein
MAWKRTKGMKARVLLAGVLCFSLLSGCGGAGNNEAGGQQGSANANKEPAATNAPKQPVTLKVFDWGYFNDDQFKKFIADPVKTKHPHITLQKITRGTGTNLEDLVAANDIPDIMLVGSGLMPQWNNMGLVFDMTDLAKKNNLDLNRFEPVAIDAARSGSAKKELFGIPFGMTFNVNYYNKDIFDKFGVSYPKDGMTWDETIELARKVARTEGGVTYYGLDVYGLGALQSTRSMVPVKAITNEINVNNDEYRKIFELGKKVWDIPNNNRMAGTSAKQNDYFFKDQNVAMTLAGAIFSYVDAAVKSGVKLPNWDMAQHPSWPDRPNTYSKADPTVAAVTKSSKHPDDAMAVISVLVSDEVQTAYTKALAVPTPLKNQDVKKVFGADLPVLQGKNVAAIFKSQNGPAAPQATLQGDANKIMNDRFNDYLQGKLDLNSALRQAEEEIAKIVEASKK